MRLLQIIAVSFLVIFVYTNYGFVESVFSKNRVKLTENFPKGMFGMIIPLSFLLLPISVLSLIATFSLQTIYVLRLSRRVASTFPKETKIKHTDNFNYYLSIYKKYFLLPGIHIFLWTIPAIVLIFLFSWV